MLFNYKGSVLIVSVLLTFVFGSSFAAKPIRVVTGSIESSSSGLLFPSTYNGTLVVKNCTDCNQRPFQFSDATKFLINGQAVTFAEFKQFGEHGDYVLTVIYDPNTHLIVEIKI